MNPDSAFVVQADRTVLLEVQHPGYAAARDRLQRFAELEKSPEYVHFYRITAVSVWNAVALGDDLDALLDWLVAEARFTVADAVVQQVREWRRRYGLLRLRPLDQDRLLLESDDPAALDKLAAQSGVRDLLRQQRGRWTVAADDRGNLKQALVKLGYPVDDRAGYRRGGTLGFELRQRTLAERAFALRAYQREAADAFWSGGSESGGCGVVVLPCGAGKTVVALAAMQLVQANTLVLTTNTVAVRQWIREVLDKTSLRPEQVGEYTGDQKEIRPVTVATYQILTWRRQKLDAFEHLDLFDRGDWGLIVYDEVHLLPAPVFRATAGIQARRRLGLTATLVREDGRQDEVFSLIGPKRYDVAWKKLERLGFLAAARCVEVRVPMGDGRRQQYESGGARSQFRIASENERKQDVLGRLLEQHAGDRVLVIGQFLDQLQQIAAVFRLPLITGATPTDEREQLYAAFRRGEQPRLVVSKVGNFAVDLPDANVAIQVSGTFGSRQEEAQRLGRILRPKADGGAAAFYSLVSDDSREQEFARRRQLFLSEQGYRYEIVAATDLQGDGRREARA